jgi:hypothetical protein
MMWSYPQKEPVVDRVTDRLSGDWLHTELNLAAASHLFEPVVPGWERRAARLVKLRFREIKRQYRRERGHGARVRIVVRVTTDKEPSVLFIATANDPAARDFIRWSAGKETARRN